MSPLGSITGPKPPTRRGRATRPDPIADHARRGSRPARAAPPPRDPERAIPSRARTRARRSSTTSQAGTAGPSCWCAVPRSGRTSPGRAVRPRCSSAWTTTRHDRSIVGSSVSGRPVAWRDPTEHPTPVTSSTRPPMQSTPDLVADVGSRAMGNGNGDTLGYAEFGNWYDAYRADRLEPALDRAMDALQRELDDALSDRDLARIRSISGRVKSKRRTWRKVSQSRYRRQIAGVDDIPRVLDDLIGMRLTCTNLRDLEMVQVALENLPRHTSRKRPLGLDPASERDYVEQPKESGYRGWHVNLGVQHDGTPVTCELQVRTLLQDSWGELTHEDTYSKSGELPPLVEVLSTRMADLLATLDDIAEDLRTELDRIDEAIVAETAGRSDATVIEADTDLAFGPGADAADILLERWRSLDRPLEISSLAWALQNEFGAEVSDDWFGYGTFKRFLRAAVPDGELSGDRQVYLLPAGGDGAAGGEAENGHEVAPDGESSDRPSDDSSTIPDEARQLRRIDRDFPLIETEQWHRVYEHLAEAWRRVGAEAPSTRMVNQLTRSARDRARTTGEPLTRRHLDHVAKAVLATTGSGDPLDADQIGETFASSVLQRLADLRIVPADDAAGRSRIGRWLLG